MVVALPFYEVKVAAVCNVELCVSTELDALGDELLMDEDSSYLDEASTAPSIPEGMPGDKSVNRVLQFDNMNRSSDASTVRPFINRLSSSLSGWCPGGRVRPSSDSCYIRAFGMLVLLLHVS